MRTATRVGDLWHVEGGVGVLGERTQDRRTAKGGDPEEGEEGDPGGMWEQDLGPLHRRWGLGWGWSLGMVEGAGSLGGRELWAMGARGRSRRKRMSQEREAQERASPVPSSFTMPSPSALFCLSKALRSRTLGAAGREGRRKDGEDGLRLCLLSELCGAPPPPVSERSATVNHE